MWLSSVCCFHLSCGKLLMLIVFLTTESSFHTRCSYMIDNVILLMNGALHNKPVKDILVKCHPLGHFAEMEAVNIAETPSDLFNAILVETPLGTMHK